MAELFYYLGNSSLPYRKIMAEHTDFSADGFYLCKAKLVIAEQTHSCNVHVCSEEDSGAGFDTHKQIPDCDAMLTNLENQFLLVRTADCTPILLYDESNRVVGAVHSGREGTRKNIAGITVRKMVSDFGSNPAGIRVWIGAGVCPKHYPVDEKTGSDFESACQKQGIDTKNFDIFHPDIQEVIRQQLVMSGIKIERISRVNACTYESDNYFSFRKDSTKNRQVNIIGMYNGKYHL